MLPLLNWSSDSALWRRRVLLCAASVAILAFSACTRIYDVKVDALHDPTRIGGHSYRIVPRAQGFDERDPNYREAEALLKNALSGRGMYEAPNPDQAEVVVEIDYGVGPLRTEIETERNLAPTVDPIVNSSIYSRNPRMNPNAVILPDGRIAQPIVQEETVRTRRVYDKHLSVSAREATVDESGRPSRGRELWRVDVEVEQQADDMSEALPILMGAASDYMETNTGSRQQIRVSEDSKSVTFVKGSP